MGKNNRKDIMKRIILLLAIAGIMCMSIASCSGAGSTDGTTNTDGTNNTEVTGFNALEWVDDPNIGRVPAGYYKRVSVSKADATYDEMLEQLESGSQGYLIVNEDGTAVFEYMGEKTRYYYDEYAFYLSEDTEKANGITYIYIGGRIVADDGVTITQFEKLSDEELSDYKKN